MNIYIGNLSYEVSNADLQNAFSAFGSIVSANVVMDRDSGQSKGFGFVEMSSKSEGEAAIASLNGTSLCGRSITVNEARPREDRGNGGFGGGNRGGSRGGNSRY